MPQAIITSIKLKALVATRARRLAAFRDGRLT